MPTGGVNSLSLKAQDDPNVVTIDGTGYSNYPENAGGPFDPYDKTSCSQSYYTSTEIEKPEGSIIDKIAYKVNAAATTNAERKIKVWLMNTDADNFGASGTNAGNSATSVPISDEYLVYNGTYNVGTTGWIEIDIENFTYGGKNILVTVYDYTNTQNGDLKFYYFNSFTTSDNDTKGYYRSLYKAQTDPTQENDGFKECKYTPAFKLTFASNGGGEPETLKKPTEPTPEDGTTINGTTVDLRWSYGADNTATHYQVLLGTDNENLSVRTDGWVARTELGTGGFATEDEFPIVNLEYDETYYWRVDVKNGEGDPVEGTVWSFTPALTEFVFENEGYWNVGANWNRKAVPGNDAIVTLNAAATITAEDNIKVADLTITEYGSLTIEGSLTITGKFANTVASKLIIEDGGQIFQTNEGVQATFNMIINNPLDWENAQDGWQLISSPFTDASINEFTIVEEGNDYDLYKFDGSKVNEEWQNLRYQENEFETEFILTRGYLASYKETGTASITGTLNNATYLYLDKNDENNKITVTVGGNMHNFFLIGNPFPFDIDMSKMEYMQHLIEGYAILDVNGGNFQYAGTSGTIKAGDAFFIKTTGVDNNSNPILYYSHTPSKSRSENHNSINLIATGAEGSDNLIISLSGAENEGFNKLENFNKDIATVFVVKNDIRYGIANFDNDVTMIDVAFEATKMGNYTISVEPTGEFSSIVLVDRFTGIETNLLVDDYHFTAMSDANNNRFILKLAVSDQQSAVSDNFVYQSGEELIIEAEGTVQIIDVMGRVVYNSNVENNRINVSDFNNGTYVVRVINETGVKVQKIIL